MVALGMERTIEVSRRRFGIEQGLWDVPSERGKQRWTSTHDIFRCPPKLSCNGRGERIQSRNKCSGSLDSKPLKGVRHLLRDEEPDARSVYCRTKISRRCMMHFGSGHGKEELIVRFAWKLLGLELE